MSFGGGQSGERRSADDYVRKGMGGVAGWFAGADVDLFRILPDRLTAAGVEGDLLEIGVFKGRSAVLLGYATRPGEKLLLCDLFGRDAGDTANEEEMTGVYGRFGARVSERAEFEATWLRFHDTLPDILEGPSGDLAARYADRRFRFAHVDGSHLYEIVRDDLAYCRSTMVPGGIVVLDDHRSLHTPGVSMATWEQVVNGGLVPLAATASKLYATWDAAACPVGADDLRALAGGLGYVPVTDDLGGHQIVVFVPNDYWWDPGRSWLVRARRGLLPPVLERGLRKVQSRRGAGKTAPAPVGAG